MKWSVEQEKALSDVSLWYKQSPVQVFRMFGYAGVGKTTLAKHIAADIDGDVLFAALTGKAAYVLRMKGCPNASTIHSLIYHSREKGKAYLKELEEQLQEMMSIDPDSSEIPKLEVKIKKERESVKKPFFTLNSDSIVRNVSLVIIDECSMVDSRLGEDLLSFGTKVLVLGDPAQLPPIKGAGFFTNAKPNVMLEDIHRQAKESPIIRMATDTRQGKELALGDYGSGCEVVDEINHEQAFDYNQILVGRNKTRFSTNRRMRQLKGIEDPYPVVDDRLVCLRNNHDKGLLNGAIFNVTAMNGVMDEKVALEVMGEHDDFSQEVMAHEQPFTGGLEIPWFARKDAEEFDYGYALTVHKSQGSQWEKVLLFDESFYFRKDRWRWLYTGITRAAKQLKVVRI